MLKKGDKKVIRGWVFYDWANSVYNLVISSAIFPIFYDIQTKKAYAEAHGVALADLPKDEKILVDFMGFQLSSSVLFSFILSASFLVVSFLSPLLSGVADYTGSKKKFLKFFCYLGAISCMTLFFFDTDRIELGMLSVFFGSIGYWNSLVFYNAFLPEIAEVKDHDRISARGFTMGYIGSMILLVICLSMIMSTDDGAQKLEYMRYAFVLVGLWWIGFSQFTYRALPNNIYGKKPEKGYLWRGFRELKLVFKEFRRTKRLKRYLVAFFFFNTGVQTVMLMATIFANKEIKWPAESGSSGLIIAILLIQILGAFGAFLMSRISEKIGNIRSLFISISIWIVICLGAFQIETPVQFYLLAGCVGLVMGGVQAIARSTYSKFLPETTDHASYFSFYDVTEKIGIVLGTLFFGLMEFWTGSIRYSVVSVAAFFIIGLILLFFVPKNEIVLTSDEKMD
ncbi:MAG: MFS transporter [Crocinitomicaceae bacterium]|nr:MFS transporter [Crocinitomicaceae bacterium]MDP4684937.1 MFS transporter [Crocinitomicaceae bacterium]MDP4866266.1 MFS transporter [Crocinitomicaceae bacterium]MDP5011087.1 MFS transporter [Crocinitomicaceae bacterium]